MKHCFEPWVDANTQILIIGTIPSVISLQNNMYYANPHNRFWKYISRIFNLPDSVDNRKQLLLEKNIGLWDALKICEGKGSLDANIINEQYNDFSSFSHIKYFLFNGQKAYAYFCKHNKHLLKKHNFIILPSTSPANASISENIKYNSWKSAILICRKNLSLK